MNLQGDLQLTPRPARHWASPDPADDHGEIALLMADLDAKVPAWELALRREVVRQFLLDRLLPPLIPQWLRDCPN